MLSTGEFKICTSCLLEIPAGIRTEDIHNLKLKFEGIIPVDGAWSMMKFHKSGIAQRLMHTIKYKGDQDLARMLGKMFGERLNDQFVEKPDVIVPVPLHERKLRSRGFNQSQRIAEGMSEVMEIPVMDLLVRIRNNPTQTRKTKQQRWQNTKGLFDVDKTGSIPESVLLVDDTLTTGATVIAASEAINKTSNSRIYIGVLALAQ